MKHMPGIDLSAAVLLARLQGTWMSLPLVCDRRMVRVLALLPIEERANLAEMVSIAYARSRYQPNVN
jgi:hypothetical protein